jgi:hypothetical protein
MKTLAIVLILVSLVAVGVREFLKHGNANGNKVVAVTDGLKTSEIQRLKLVKTVTSKSRMGGGLQVNLQRKGQLPVTGEIRKVSLPSGKSAGGVKDGGAVMEPRSLKEAAGGEKTPIVFPEDSSDRWVEMAYLFNPGGGDSAHSGSETLASNDNSVFSGKNDNRDQDNGGTKEVAESSFRDNDRDHDQFEKRDRPGRDDEREHDRFEKPEHHGR